MNTTRKATKTFARQLDQTDCGIACLLSVLRYHGGNATFERLRELSGTDKVGTTMLGLYQAAQQVGLEVEGLQADAPINLRELTAPAILHVVVEGKLEHYVIYYPTSGPQYLIGDPARGVYQASEDELVAIWHTRALLKLTPTDKLVLRKTENTLKTSWLSKVISPDASLLTVSVFLGLIASILNFATAFFYQKLIDDLLPKHNAQRLLLGVVLLLFILVIRSLALYARGIVLNRQGFDFNTRISNLFYSNLLFLPQSFFDNRKTGDLISRMNDTRRIQQTTSYLAGNVLVNLLGAVCGVIYLFTVSPIAACMVLAGMPIYFVVLALYNKTITTSQKDVMVAYAVNESNYIDTIQGINVIKANNKEGLFIKLTKSINSIFQQKIKGLTQVSIKLSLILEILSVGITISIIAQSIYTFLNNGLTAGELVAIFSIIGTVLSATTSLALTNIQVQEAKVALDRMFEFTAIEAEYDWVNPSAPAEPILFECLQMVGLEFSFPGRAPLISGLSLTIRKNQFNVLVGESGCGKSTLLQIMQKLYFPSLGHIKVNGEDWKTLSVWQWRSMIGVVPQDAKMFTNNVLANIALEDTEADKVISFCSHYGFDYYFKSFPQGYATLLGEGGTNLSGGQKQLVTLARALYKRPQILLLDEPTASMDSDMELFVMQLLHRIKAHVSIFMITHRLHNLAGADQVYKFKNGTLSLSSTDRANANPAVEVAHFQS